MSQAVIAFLSSRSKKSQLPAKWLLSLLCLLPLQQANATLITFEAELQGSNWSGIHSTFWTDTGLAPAPQVNWLGRVTIDTRVAPTREEYYGEGSGFAYYEFDQPGTSMSIIVGNLTLTWERFWLDLNDDAGGDCDLLYVRGIGRPSGPVSGTGVTQITASTCRTDQRLTDYSLETLVAELGLLAGSRYESVITASDWQVIGNSRRLREVPEPHMLTLLALGLGVLGIWRRVNQSQGMLRHSQ